MFSDAHELHGEEKKRRMSSNRKEEKKKLPKEKGKSHGGAKRADKLESDVDDEHQSQRCVIPLIVVIPINY